jgi:hypothetical protein
MGKKKRNKKKLKQSESLPGKGVASSTIPITSQTQGSVRELEESRPALTDTRTKNRVQVVGRRSPEEIKQEAGAIIGGHAAENVREYQVGSHSGLPKVTSREIPSRYTKAVDQGVLMPAPGTKIFQRPEPYKPPPVVNRWIDRRSVVDDLNNAGHGFTWGLLFRFIRMLRGLFSTSQQKFQG